MLAGNRTKTTEQNSKLKVLGKTMNTMPSNGRNLLHEWLLTLLTTVAVVGYSGSSPTKATDELDQGLTAFDARECSGSTGRPP
jgi:hypothetical protein